LAHATWHPDGVLAKLGVLDFAGGTVVHMSAGWAALASALFLKRRNEANHAPARITYVMIGTGLLWFGWFGFNAGSAFGANHLAVTALATSTTASAAAGVTWIFFDMLRKPQTIGNGYLYWGGSWFGCYNPGSGLCNCSAFAGYRYHIRRGK
jgi:Amt family ammonium transporter